MFDREMRCYTPQGWQVPDYLVSGVCYQCKRYFEPKLEKQFWCYDCRTFQAALEMEKQKWRS